MCLGVLLAIVLVTLTPVAYIDTPDQLWLGGYYDSDEDDLARRASPRAAEPLLAHRVE